MAAASLVISTRGRAPYPKAAVLHLSLLPPRSYRLRFRPPEWEVTDDEGAVVAWIEQRDLPTSGRPFYSLVALHPTTRERIPLELSTSRDERLKRLAAFLEDPDQFSQHYPSGGQAARELEARLGGPKWKMRRRQG